MTLIHPWGNVFEMEKGDGVQKPGKDDMVEIRFGGIETAFISQKSPQNPTLPVALEEDNFKTCSVTYDGSYGEKENRQRLSDTIVAVISNMTLRQKVLIIEELEADEKRPSKQEEKRVRIC